MRKRLAAGVATATAAFAVWGAAPASAYDDAERDRHPSIPCNVYPPGKPFQVLASPSSATVRKGANINVYAAVTRGTGTDIERCKYHIVILRYKSRPGVAVKAHRTQENGAVGFVAGPVTGTLYYYFDLLYNNQYTSSNVGVVRVS